MFKNIVLVDPNKDDIVEHSLYLNGYKNFCIKNKIEPSNFYIVTEHWGTTYELAMLLKNSRYRGEKRADKSGYFDLKNLLTYMSMEEQSTLILINEKKLNYLNSNPVIKELATATYNPNNNKLIINKNVKSVCRSEKLVFIIFNGLSTVPGPTYNKELIKLYKDICVVLKVKER